MDHLRGSRSRQMDNGLHGKSLLGSMEDMHQYMDRELLKQTPGLMWNSIEHYCVVQEAKTSWPSLIRCPFK